MSFAENAEPIPMLRLVRTSPGRLPVLGFLGPMRAEVFLGRRAGHNFVFAGRCTLLPLSASPTSTAAGSASSLRPTWSSASGSPPSGAGRRSHSIAYPRRSAIAPGLYLARVPGVPGLDFRVEGFYTDLPNDPRPGVFFRNQQYRDGFRNHGQLLGHPVGRQGRGILLGSSYWQDGVQRVELTYFQNRISPGFLPEGGDQRRMGVQVQHRFHSAAAHSDVRVLTGFHYERWNIPVLANGARSNYGFSARLIFCPRARD